MKVTPEKKAAFLAALAETANVSRACAAIEISRMCAYRWRAENPEFSKEWVAALAVGMSSLEDEALRRARDGVEEPVFHRGEVCGTIRKYSDTLAIFLLKAHDPKYRDRQTVDLNVNTDLVERLEAGRRRAGGM